LGSDKLIWVSSPIFLVRCLLAKSGRIAFFSILLLGISATLLSALPTFTYHLPGRCSLGYVEAGYPFPWYIRPISSQGMACCNPAGFCTLFYTYNPNVQVRISYFLVDTAFYGALAVGIIAAYRSTIMVKGRLSASLT